MIPPSSGLRAVYSDLIKLAAELVRGQGLPTSYDDGEFFVSTPQAERRRILKAVADTEERCKAWGVRVRHIADKLSKAIPARLTCNQTYPMSTSEAGESPCPDCERPICEHELPPQRKPV